MNITRRGFEGVVANAFAGLEFAPEAPQHVFPAEMFVGGSDFTPIEKDIDKVIEGLTTWEPKTKAKGIIIPEKTVTVQGKDYDEAVTRMNYLFLANMWADGLPITPPTKERVSWILKGTDLPPDTVVAKILPRGGITTVETVAVSLAMAGGRPEYMPVLLASIEAIVEPEAIHRWWNTTTGDTYPVVIVNGPISKQIRLNSGYGCFGPDPMHPAGATIGRAIRFLLMNAGGAIPGSGTMAIYGNAARYTNVVFAEDEDGMPPGWEPLNVERGFPKGTNTVTVHPMGTQGTLYAAETGSEEETLQTLDNWAAFLKVPNYSYWSNTFIPDGSPGILLISRSGAQSLSRLGWSKEKVKTFLWENSKVPQSPLVKRWIDKNVAEGKIPEEYVKDPMPISMSPMNIMIVVAGGTVSNHAHLMQVSLSGKVISKEIKLPAKWDELLQKAEDDFPAKWAGNLPEMRN